MRFKRLRRVVHDVKLVRKGIFAKKGNFFALQLFA